MSQHKNARLTFHARLTLVRRIEAGKRIAHVADEMGISRQTGHKWWRRYLSEGEAGLHDPTSTPDACPTGPILGSSGRSSSCAEWCPATIAAWTGIPASTVHLSRAKVPLDLTLRVRPANRKWRRHLPLRPAGFLG